MRVALSETIRRCHQPSHPQYHCYGARGITVCQRWRDSFDAFVEDMGVRPNGLTLERMENDKGYYKGNCMWATRQEQALNTRRLRLVEWNGRTMCISEWERDLGMRAGTLKARLGPLGYSVEEAFTKPVKCGGVLPNRRYKTRLKPDMSKAPRGFDSPLTKLSQQEVQACRARWQKGGETFSGLGREFGVTVTTMSNAVQGQKAYRESK